MKHTKLSAIGALALSAFVNGHHSPSAAAAQQTGVPDLTLWIDGQDIAAYFEQESMGHQETVSAYVSGSTPEKDIRISYRASIQGSKYPNLFANQQFPTPFYPTSVSPAGSGKLWVCGKALKSDATVIQMWDFESPLITLGGQTPGGQQTGPALQAGSRKTVKTVYDADVPGRGLVQASSSAFTSINGSTEPTGVFLLFADSKDIYLSDNIGNMTLLASPSPGASFHLPELTQQTWRDGYMREHVSDGYLYFFDTMEDVDAFSESEVFRIVAHDSDRDGVIDLVESVSLNDVDARDYANHQNWVQ